MVRILFTALLLILFYGVKSQESPAIIPASYALSFDQPLMFGKGSLLKIECDSLFVLNHVSFSYFKSLREVLADHSAGCSVLVELYKNSVKENMALAEKLMINSRETDKLNMQQYVLTKDYLNSAQKSLDESIIKLENAGRLIDKSNRQVTRLKHRNTMEKILFGIGGLGLGIFTGIVLK